MFKVNENFCSLDQTYLFSEVAKHIASYEAKYPDRTIIRMGIGDVTRPLCPAVINALKNSVEEQEKTESFKGYGPEQGYSFLTEKISEVDYRSRGIEINSKEIFVSDGAKSDTGNIGDILSVDNSVALTDPVYPVYLDTNVMAGRAGKKDINGNWDKIEYLKCSAENNFIPDLPLRNPDIIYLCYPNNPTGTTLNRAELKKWVDYALENGSLILFDSAYEAFITEDDVPHSIYEIPDARKVAIEFRSFSKTAGFTGLRCAYTVIPDELKVKTSAGTIVSINRLWNRRQCTKFNGASYLAQRAAEAVYSPEGQNQIKEIIRYYLTNASILRTGLTETGLKAYGGINAPYIWVKAPDGVNSWEFFSMLLEQCQIASTPGIGFGDRKSVV